MQHSIRAIIKPLLFTLLGLLILFPTIAFSRGKTITMFIPDTDWPPYLMNDPRYPDGGVLLEVMQAVVKPMGYTMQTRRLPNKRGWELLEAGQIDCHAKAKEWVKNPDMYLWTEPFMLNEDIFLYKAYTPWKYSTPEKCYGMTVACIRGFIYPRLEPHFGPHKIKRVDVAKPYTMLELLERGRVDAAIVNRSETLWLFKTRRDLHRDHFRMDPTAIESAGYRYVFTKAAPWKPFIRQFNQRLNQMKKNGELDAILKQYR